MPAATYTTTADFLNSTMPKWVKERQSNMLGRDVPLLNKLRAKCKTTMTGDQILIPAQFYNHSAPTRLTNGYDQIALAFASTGLPLIASWADVVQPIGISGNEMRKNGGNTKVLDLRDTRLKNVHDHMERQLQQALAKGDLAAWTDIVPLDGESNADGALEDAATASQNNTVHGVSKATFATTAEGWVNRYQNASNDASSNLLPAMYAVQTSCRAVGSAQKHLEAPDHEWFATEASANNLKSIVQPQEFYVSKDDLDAGKVVEVFGGKKINILQDDMPAAWGFMLLDFKQIMYIINNGDGERDMAQSEWFDQRPQGIDARVSYVSWMGQQMFPYLGTHGIVDNSDTL